MNDRNDSNDRPLAKGEKKGASTGAGAVAGGVAGGVIGGATTGALAGGVTGPVGAAIGAVAGAVIGAVAGRSKADPKVEDNYWRDNYESRPYVKQGQTYDDYGPAYSHGVNAYTQYPDRHFDEMEPQLQTDWNRSRGNSSLEWDHAKHASRDAWQRVKDAGERAMPGDADGDGR